LDNEINILYVKFLDEEVENLLDEIRNEEVELLSEEQLLSFEKAMMDTMPLQKDFDKILEVHLVVPEEKVEITEEDSENFWNTLK
jgi:hypothetical protein